MAPRPALLLFACLATSGLGCAGTEAVVRRAVPATLDEGVDFLEDPESQRRIQRLLSDPQIQQASRQLTSALVEGALDGASDEARQARLRAVTTQYLDAVTAAAARNLREDLTPAMAQAVQRTLGAALSPRTRQEASAFVDSVTRSAVTALVQSAGRGLHSDLGPAMRAVLEDDLGPGLQRVIRRDLAPALREAVQGELVPVVGLVSREASKQIVLGAADAFDELQFRQRVSEFENTFWNRVDATIHRGIRMSQIIAWLLGLGLAVLAVLFARAVLLRRRIEAERARSERMLLGVMQGIQQGCDKPDVEALLAGLRERHPELANETYFEELARRAQTQGRVRRPRRRL